jgi:hypothetical protein
MRIARKPGRAASFAVASMTAATLALSARAARADDWADCGQFTVAEAACSAVIEKAEISHRPMPGVAKSIGRGG